MVAPMRESLDANFFELTQILFPASDPAYHKVIQITSCHHSEGVTTVTLSLAAFLARVFGGGVLALEANARRPSFSNLFGLAADGGLVDGLVNQRPIDRSVLKVPQHHFSVVPAGTLGKIPAAEWERALFARLPEAVRQLRETHRCILVDSPPLIPHADSTLISHCADGVVIVVEAGVTPSEVLDHALGKLAGAKATILGTILNKREYFIPKWVYHFI
jgi:protein-tyrosine kinase